MNTLAQSYSDLKPAWHLDRIQALRDTGRCVPAQIQLVISDLCNHDCPWCAYRSEGYSSNQLFGEVKNGKKNHNPNRMIPFAKCRQILRDAKALGVLGVQFTGGGEPTVHPEHLEIFSDALGLGLACALVTNGTLLRSGWQDVLPRFSWIRVSLDAGNPETYQKIRRVNPGIWKKTLDNITALSKKTRVDTSFVVMSENYGEAARAAKIAKLSGASSIRFAALFGPKLLAYYDGWLDDAVAAVEDAKSEASEHFEIHDMFGQRVEDLRQRRPDFPACHYQQMNVYIGGDQNVYRCCNTAYNTLGLVGSVKEQGFAELFRAEETTEKYRSFDPASCAHCAFNGKNAVLNAMVERPQHVEFS